jgi:hypothetical protein
MFKNLFLAFMAILGNQHGAVYANASNQVATLKELYDDPTDYLKDLVYKKNPLLALISKDESPSGFAGKYIPVPLIYGGPQGRSSVFATAQANQTAPADTSFFVYRVKNYEVVTIENELLEATKDNAGAFIDQAKLNMDTGIRNISNDIARQLYGNVNGARGQMVAGAITSGAITLTEPSDIVQFEVGMTLVSYSVSGTTATQSTGAALGYVISVNRGAGTMVVSTTQGGSAGTPSNWNGTNFPYLAVEGDVSFASGGLASSATGSRQLSGLAAWIPSSDPASNDSFWGINRSVDSTRLAGVRYDGSLLLIEEALNNAASLVAREGGQPDMCFMSFASYVALENQLGSKVQYVSVKHDMADIAFAGITVNAPYGPITVIPDRNCPARTAYLLQMDTLKLRSLGKAPHILTYGLEGLEGLRVGNADALEIRIGMYGNMICSAPGWNAVVTLQA